MNITYEQIMTFGPCYDPVEIDMPKDYSDTIPNFIREYRGKTKRVHDVLLVLLDEDFLSTKELWSFAVWCVRQVQYAIEDERSIKALEVVEAHINGKATKEDIDDAAAEAELVNYTLADQAAVYAAHAASNDDYADAAYAYHAAHYAALAADAANVMGVDRAKDNYAAARNKQIDKLLEIFESKS